MKRIPLGKVTIDPRRTNIFMDSCSFDPKYTPEDMASQRLFHLYDAGQINIIIAHSNMKELAHPNVHAYVKNEANAKIFSISVQLTAEELALKERILDLTGGFPSSDTALISRGITGATVSPIPRSLARASLRPAEG